MKKTIYAILALCLLFALSACQKPCEHIYTEEITTEASCTQVGTKTFTCSQCGDSYTEEIAMLAHSFGKATVTKKATCIEVGEKAATCTVCGKTEITETIPVASHKYKSKVTTAATCTVEGVKTFTCSVCDDSYTKTIPATNKHSYTSNVIQNPTYTQKGKTEYTCSDCGDTYTESSPKLSAATIIDAASTGSKYISTALDYMNDALKNYKAGNHTKGRNNTSNMLVTTGLAINSFREAYNQCGNSNDIKEAKALLSQIIKRLEYVQKYSSISNSNYVNIILDIYNAGVYQDVLEYEKQLVSIFEGF